MYLYFHSNEYLPPKILQEKEDCSRMLSIAGGSDIALILSGLHRVKHLDLCDLNAEQFNVFKSKKEFIENDALGLNFLLFYYYLVKNFDLTRISKFQPKTYDFVKKNLDEIVESKNQLYNLFLKDYVDAFSRYDVYNHLSNKEINVNYIEGNVFDHLSDAYDVVYLSNAVDFVPVKDFDYVVESASRLRDDAIIYDSSKHLGGTIFPWVKRYTKEEFVKALSDLY